jgi:hypothetical protein
MKAEITMSQLYYNDSLMNFFFRDQAKRTLEELMTRASEPGSYVLDDVEDYVNEQMDGDLDTLEEMFYEESVEDIAEVIGIELNEEDEEDE